MSQPSWAGMSFDVMTALTPGRASALDVSILRILACAWGLLSTRPTSMPGADMSAPKRARPVTLSTPSGRTGRVPMVLYLVEPASDLLSSGIGASLPFHFLRGVEHRADDLVITRAAAEIAGEPVAHLGLRRVVDCVPEDFWRRSGNPACRCRIAARHAPGTSSAADAAVSPSAMPSIVSISWPPASAPSTRQEQTSRPSSVTEQAPQSPVPQPSLLPVRPSRSRRTSSSASSDAADDTRRCRR